MSADYWLGVLTIPAIAATIAILFIAHVRLIDVLDKRFGIAFELKMHRDVEGISDYTLRRDVWWERSFGLVFVGGWYHEPPVYEGPSRRRINRWIGIGRADGPCWMAYRKRDLGVAIAAAHE